MKDLGITAVFGLFLMLITIILCVCYFVFDNLAMIVFGTISGIIGTILILLAKKVDEEKAILSVMLLMISMFVPIVSTIPKPIAMILVAILVGCSIYFVIWPDNKNKPLDNNTAKN
jgi:uncharacterized membrane protein (UPF0136 family)